MRGRYLLRRARRLLPAYLPFCAVWLCVMLPLYGLGTVQSVRVAAGNLLMLGFFAGTPAMINWYVSALALTLMLAPLVYGLMARASHPRRCAVLVAAACFAGGLCFIGTEAYMAGFASAGLCAGHGGGRSGAGGRHGAGAYALALAGGGLRAGGALRLLCALSRNPRFLRHVLAPLRFDRARAVRGAGLAVFQGGAGLGGVCAAFARWAGPRLKFSCSTPGWRYWGKRFGLAQGAGFVAAVEPSGASLRGLRITRVVERCVKRAARGA